jgi:hypothetical protein
VTEAQYAAALHLAARREMRAFRIAEMVDHTAYGGPPKGVNPKRSDKRLADCQACADRGMSLRETAAHLGLTEKAVEYMRRYYGVRFRDGRFK